MPNPERLDHEIARIEQAIKNGQREAIAALATVIPEFTAAADLFHIAWRIRSVASRVRGPSFPAPEAGQAPYSESEKAAINTAEDFFRKCLGRLNDKITREKQMIALAEREAFAAATVRVLEQFGRNFKLRLKGNQGRTVAKLAADDVEFD